MITAAIYGVGMYIGLSAALWIMRETFTYDVFFNPVEYTAWLAQKEAFESSIPALAIIPWAFEYFGRLPLHVITGLLDAWKSVIVAAWTLLGFLGSGYQEP